MTSTLPAPAAGLAPPCSLEPFPRVARTARTHRRLCGECRGEVAATREVHFSFDEPTEPAVRREHSDICDRPACEHAAILAARRGGAWYDSTEHIYQAVPIGPETWPDVLSSWQRPADSAGTPWHTVDKVKRLDADGRTIPAWPGAVTVPAYRILGARCGIELSSPGTVSLVGEPAAGEECPDCLAASEVFRQPAWSVGGPPPIYPFTPPPPVEALRDKLLGCRW